MDSIVRQIDELGQELLETSLQDLIFSEIDWQAKGINLFFCGSVDLLENVSLNRRSRMWFHQDGVLPHNFRDIISFLNQKRRERWRHHYRPVGCSARSSDPNQPDHFLWGYLKQIVYKDTIRPFGGVLSETSNPYICKDIKQNVTKSNA